GFEQHDMGGRTGATLLERMEPRLRAAALWRDALRTTEAAWIASVLELLKPRVKALDQLVDELRPFLGDEPELDPSAAAKHLGADVRPLLVELADGVDAAPLADAAAI